MNHQEKAAWATRRMRLRRRVARVLDDIQNGREISEMDLSRLHNFCMVMLMVLAKVSPGTLNTAVREAEIAAWIKRGEFDVIMDDEVS